MDGSRPPPLARSPGGGRAGGPRGGVGERLRRAFAADARASDDRAWTGSLALFRVVFVAFVAIPAVGQALRWSTRILPGLPEEAWWPVSFFAWLPTSVLADAGLARALCVLDLVLLWLGLFGVATRWTLGLAAVLSLYVLGLPQNQVKVTQNGHVLWFLTLLAVGPSGRMLSVDAAARALRAVGSGRVEPDVASPLALPTLRYAWVLFGLVFLAPGLAKVHAAFVGDWTPDHLRAVLRHQRLELGAYEPGTPPWVEGATAFPSAALAAGGVLVVLFEVGFVFAVLFRRMRPYVALAGLLFHATTAALLRIRFAALLPAYVALVDVPAAVRRVRERLGLRRLALRDGPGPRRAIGAALRSADVLGVLEPAPSGGASGGASGGERRGARRALHAVGSALVVAQLATSVVRVVGMRAETGAPLAETAVRWSAWRFPFDAYPDFTRPRSIVEVREVRLRARDGRETAVPPSAFAATYGPASKTSWLFEHALARRDPERRRARLVPLVRAVVENAPAELRRDASEASLHTVRWRVDAAAPPTRLSETLEVRFPLGPP